MQRMVKSRPVTAVQVTAMAEVFQLKLFRGRSTHFVLSSLGFCLSGHSEQFEERPLEFIVPRGQLTHSQQQGDFVTLRSPGLQSNEHTDNGTPVITIIIIIIIIMLYLYSAISV